MPGFSAPYGGINQCQVVNDAEVGRQRIAEARHDETLRGNDVDALAKIATGEEAVFRKAPCNPPSRRPAGPIVRPEAGTIGRT